MKNSACCLLLLLVTACAGQQGSKLSTMPRAQLPSTDGTSYTLPLRNPALWTVLVFFSADCDCQAAHDARLRELDHRYRPRGVRFFAIDSEIHAGLARDAAEARSRGYGFPMLIDRHAAVAKALGAEYSTYSVVLDARGRIRYRGGIDSDLVHLRSDATFYLRDALEDLLAGREPHRAYGEALGCALRTE